MTDHQWGQMAHYQQPQIMMNAGQQQVPHGFVVCMMPCYVPPGQGGQGCQAVQAGVPAGSMQFQMQQDGSMGQMWMAPVQGMAGGMSAGQSSDDSRSNRGAGGAGACGARQGASGAGFQPMAQASGAAASGGKEATVFNAAVQPFVPKAQQQQAGFPNAQPADGSTSSSFQMRADAEAFQSPTAKQKMQQGLANSRFQQGGDHWALSKDRIISSALNLEAAGSAKYVAPKRQSKPTLARPEPFPGLGRQQDSAAAPAAQQDGTAAPASLGPSAGWGAPFQSNVAPGAGEPGLQAAQPKAVTNAADARGWARTPTQAPAPLPMFPGKGADLSAKGMGKGKAGAGLVLGAGAMPADAGSPLHKNTEGKAYVPPHLRNRQAQQGAQDAAKKEEAKKEEEPKPLEAAEFPSLISAVTPKAKGAWGLKKGKDAEPEPVAEPKAEERKEPVLRGTAWGKDAAKEREEAAKRRKEEEQKAAQEAARKAAEEKAAAVEAQQCAAASEVGKPAAQPAPPPIAQAAAQPQQPADEPEVQVPTWQPAEKQLEQPQALEERIEEEEEEDEVDDEPAAAEEEAPQEAPEEAPEEAAEEAEVAEEAAAEAPAEEWEAEGEAVACVEEDEEAKSEKRAQKLSGEETANVETNDEGGETNGEETNDEAGRPETDVSAPDAEADAAPMAAPAEEAKPGEEAAGESAAVLGGIFASKGKKKLKNLAVSKPADKEAERRMEEEAAEKAREEEEAQRLAEEEQRRAEEAAEKAREDEMRRRAEEEAREREQEQQPEEDDEAPEADARETGEEDLGEEEEEEEEGTEDMEVATDDVEAASADPEADFDDGEEHPNPHAVLLSYRTLGGLGEDAPEEVETLSAKEDPTGWRPEDQSKVQKSTSWRRSEGDSKRFGDRGGDRRGGDRKGDNRSDRRASDKDWERPPRETLASLSNRAEHAYKRVTGELDREAELRRCTKSLLNKICPENCQVIASRIATEAMVKTEEELEIVIHLIFQKALAEPHYCETYVDLVFHLKGEMPEFPKADGGKPLTFKAALLNVTQNEYEAMPTTLAPTEEEKEKFTDPEELRFMVGDKKKKLLANMKFIGHLFLKDLLTGKIIASVISELLMIDGSGVPEEHVVECVCELVSSIGYTLENSKCSHTLVQVMSRLKDLKGQKNKAGKDILSKRIQFQIQDLLDMRSAGWAKKTFKAAAKTKEEIRQEAERDEKMKERGKEVAAAEYVIAGKKSLPAKDASGAGRAPAEGDWDVVQKNRSRR